MRPRKPVPRDAFFLSFRASLDSQVFENRLAGIHIKYPHQERPAVGNLFNNF
jgi:hypothetical protein